MISALSSQVAVIICPRCGHSSANSLNMLPPTENLAKVEAMCIARWVGARRTMSLSHAKASRKTSPEPHPYVSKGEATLTTCLTLMHYCGAIPSLADRREQLSRKFFKSVQEPPSCLSSLLPNPRDPSITTRLRFANKFPRLPSRMKNTRHLFPMLCLIIRLHIQSAIYFSILLVFTALHGMQTRSCDENSVRPSVHLSVRPSNACIVTKRQKDMFRFLYDTKDNLS